MPGTSAPQTVTLTAGAEYGPITVEKSNWVRFKNLTPGMDLKFSYEPVNGRKSTGVSVVEGEAIKFTVNVKAIFLTSALGGTVTVDASDDFVIRPANNQQVMPPAALSPVILSAVFEGRTDGAGSHDIITAVPGKTICVVDYSVSTDGNQTITISHGSGEAIMLGFFGAQSGEAKSFYYPISASLENQKVILYYTQDTNLTAVVHYFLK